MVHDPGYELDAYWLTEGTDWEMKRRRVDSKYLWIRSYMDVLGSCIGYPHKIASRQQPPMSRICCCFSTCPTIHEQLQLSTSSHSHFSYQWYHPKLVDNFLLGDISMSMWRAPYLKHAFWHVFIVTAGHMVRLLNMIMIDSTHIFSQLIGQSDILAYANGCPWKSGSQGHSMPWTMGLPPCQAELSTK